MLKSHNVTKFRNLLLNIFHSQQFKFKGIPKTRWL